MTESFATPGDDERSEGGQVRTYRGRTIEELIPRIREELGPDAIILREREGLMGGIGGFFAQRCVEIDAQAAPRLSVYDDDFDEEDLEEAEEAVEEPPAPAAPPAAASPPVPAPRPVAPFLDEASFAARLEEATLAVDQAPPAPDVVRAPDAAPPAPVAPPPSAASAPPAFIAFDELGEAEAAPPRRPRNLRRPPHPPVRPPCRTG